MYRFVPRVTSVFRAWEIRPLAVGLSIWMFLSLTLLAVVASFNSLDQNGVEFSNLPWLIPLLLLVGVVVFGGLKLGSIWLSRAKRFRAGIYLLTGVAVAFLVVALRQSFVSDQTPDYWTEPSSQIRLFAVVLILYLVLHTTIGLADLKLKEQLRETRAAQASLQVQRSRLIESQEKTRKQIADFLHDRLQSDLVLLGLQMQQEIKTLDPKTQAIANTYLDEIERIRQVDVRAVSRALAPELDGPSLGPALQDLTDRYSKVSRIELVLNEGPGLSPEQRLASYRIIEQALLNAAGHGTPSWIRLELNFNGERIEITVSNDGADLPEELTPGSGIALIESWVETLSGSWSLSASNGEVTLKATLAG
jgi:two-component system, NarL family, sensor histidine kinase FusK